MKKYHIKIKFCGGCNPEIDRGLMIRRFKEMIESSDIKDKIIFDDDNDILIVVQGCQHACLEEDGTFAGNYHTCISVKGRMIDFRIFSEDKLPQILFDKIKQLVI